MRSAKDGEPYFCMTCGGNINQPCRYGQNEYSLDCRMESRAAAQRRRDEWLRLEMKRAPDQSEHTTKETT